MAKLNIAKIFHNEHVYELEYGGWLNHRYGEASNALTEVYSNDIHLNNTTIGKYKAAKSEEYDSLKEKCGMTFMKYLRQSFKTEFDMEWDETIKGLKKTINDSCIPYLLHQKADASVEERTKVIYLAALNGHVASTYFIATAMSDGNDENCLSWLTLAHNRGHIGAAYDMAAYFDRKGNTLDALRCLIISADGGCDFAYLTLFNNELLKSILWIQDSSKLDAMLNELIDGSHSSSARYFKAVRLMVGATPIEGMALMESFCQTPKKKPADKDIDEVYRNQMAFTEEFLHTVLSDINSRKPPLLSLMECSLNFSDPRRVEEGKPCALSFKDYRESLELFKKFKKSVWA